MTTSFDTAAIGTPTPGPRIGTLNPYDFAYWASTFVAPGVPADYVDYGPETDGLALVSWAAGQVGTTLSTEYDIALTMLAEGMIDIEVALKTRGAILVGTDRLAVCMGLDDVVSVVNGRYFQYKTTADSTYQTLWQYAARVPGLRY